MLAQEGRRAASRPTTRLLRRADEATVSAERDAPSLFTAVQEQLGLKLESTKGPAEVLMIDHVEKPTPDKSITNDKSRSVE